VQEMHNIGSKYNRSPRPFLASSQETGSAPRPVNVQYNSPMNLYSADSTAQSASLQTGMQR